MRILHITSSLEVGGAQRVRLELVRKLIALGHDPENHQLVYFSDGPMRQKFENIGIKTVHIAGNFLTFGPTALKRLKNVINQFKPDIIHSQLWAANIFARIANFRTGIPVICDLHSMPEVNGFWRNLFEKCFPFKACQYVAVSQAVAQTSIQEFHLGQDDEYSKSNVSVIKNGVDSNKFKFSFAAREDLREELKIDEECFVVGAVGRLEAVKNFDKLILAFAQFCKILEEKHVDNKDSFGTNVRLVIVGDGSQKSELKRLAKKNGLNNKVIFYTPARGVYRFYSLFDCMAISSKSEGLSVALLEALFAGLMVITTCQSHDHEVVIDQQNGYVVKFGDINSMANAMGVIFDKFNPDFSERPPLIGVDFEISRMAKQYQDLYEQVASKANL